MFFSQEKKPQRRQRSKESHPEFKNPSQYAYSENIGQCSPYFAGNLGICDDNLKFLHNGMYVVYQVMF